MKKRALLVTIILVAPLGSAALRAQVPASPACAVWSVAENRCLQLEPSAQARAACAVWSGAENRCLDVVNLPPAPVSAAERTDPNRLAALAALRAVQSVLDGGANTSEFKKYYLDAKVKVDALPDTPLNAVLVTVSDTYNDASTLFIAAQVHEISAAQVRALKQKYLDATNVRLFLDNLPDVGVNRLLSSRVEQDRAVIWLRGTAQALLHFAEAKLAEAK